MNRLELLNALKAVMPGLAKGVAVIQGADTVMLSPGVAQTYNDHVSVSHPAPVEVTAAVRGRELVAVLERMAGLEITAELKSGENTQKPGKLVISDGHTILSMTIVESQAAGMVQALDLEGLEWENLPPNFVRSLALCIPAASRNPAHGPWAGVWVGPDRLLSTDNFRASWADLDSHMIRPGMPFTPFVLPVAAAGYMAAMEGLECWAATQSWAHFLASSGAVFSSRLLGGEYPVEGVQKLFAGDGSGEYELPEVLAPALERARVMAAPDDSDLEYVEIRSEGNDIVVIGRRSSGSVTDPVPAGENGWPPGASIRISPKYLLDIMGATRRFRVLGNLLAFEAEGFRHVTSTVAVGDK